jgi:hypothetical protein
MLRGIVTYVVYSWSALTMGSSLAFNMVEKCDLDSRGWTFDETRPILGQ